jgi:hypothetical protein
MNVWLKEGCSIPTYFEPKRKHRKCPFCKSKVGFSIEIILGGIQSNKVGFDGKLISSERSGTDNMDPYGYCLNCKKAIEIEKLDISNT